MQADEDEFPDILPQLTRQNAEPTVGYEIDPPSSDEKIKILLLF